MEALLLEILALLIGFSRQALGDIEILSPRQKLQDVILFWNLVHHRPSSG
jgi:hypothetical protein